MMLRIYLHIILLHTYVYTYICACIYIYIHIHILIYGHALRGPPPTPPNGLGSPPFCGVGCGGVDWDPPASFSLCGVWWVGTPLLLPLWCGVLWVGIPPHHGGVERIPSHAPDPTPQEKKEGIPSHPQDPTGRVGIPLPPPCGVGFGGVEFVLGSLGGLVVVVKLLYSAPNHILWEKILF